MKKLSSASSKVMFLVNFIVIVMVITGWSGIESKPSGKVTGASVSEITGAYTHGDVMRVTDSDGKTQDYENVLGKWYKMAAVGSPDRSAPPVDINTIIRKNPGRYTLNPGSGTTAPKTGGAIVLGEGKPKEGEEDGKKSIPLGTGAQTKKDKIPVGWDINGDKEIGKDDPHVLVNEELGKNVLDIVGGREKIEGFDAKKGTITTEDGVWKIKGDGSIIEREDGTERHSYQNGGVVHYIEGEKTTYLLPDKTGEALSSVFAKKASINKKGELVIYNIVIDNKDNKLLRDGTIERKDGSKIIALDEGVTKAGVMEVDKDGKNIIIKIEGERDHALTKAQYNQLTGEVLNVDSAEGIKKAAFAADDLKFVIDGFGRAGLSLDQIGDNRELDAEGFTRTYWVGNTKVRINRKKENGEQKVEVDVVTSSQGFIDAGEAGAGEPKGPYERTSKQLIGGEMKVSSTATVSEDKEVITDWELDEKGNIKNLRIQEKKVEWEDEEYKSGTLTRDVELDYVYDELSKRSYYKHPDKDVFYNHEYGGWYVEAEKGGYRKATDEDLAKAELTEEELEGLGESVRENTDKKDKGEGKPTRAARNVQRVFNTLESAASGGLGGFFTLFMEDEKLAEWREKVDDVLCKTVIGGGKECWSSKICSKWVESRPSGGITYTETPAGMIDIAVHVEAHKEPVIYPGDEGEATEYLYKVTYLVKNTEDDPLGFNVVFEGDRTARLYNTNVIIQPKGQSSRLGASALVQYSNYNYETVCIEMSHEVESASAKNIKGKVIAKTKRMLAKKDAGSEKVSRVCNRINAREKILVKKGAKPGLQQAGQAPGEELRQLEI